MALNRILSGAQTGVDRAALDVALELGIPCGGWVPRGRIDELGRIPDRYPNLRETESADYNERTAANVRESDGTLIISRGPLTGGSLYTQEVAVELGRTCLHLDVKDSPIEVAARSAVAWINSNNISALNIAGPRASKDSEIHGLATGLLTTILA